MTKPTFSFTKFNVIKSLPFDVKSLALMTVIGVSLAIGIISVWGVPLFSDSAFHASVIREILRNGVFPVYSPIGWVAMDMHPTSFQPFLTHPPSFYLLNSSLAVFGVSIQNSLSLTNIFPTVLAVIFLYKLSHELFGMRVALVSALLLALMPMSIWLNVHRIMEPYQYAMSLAAVYYAFKFIRLNSVGSLILSAIFCAAVLYIKITSLFIVLAILFFIAIKKRMIKPLVIFVVVISLLYAPYAAYSLNTRGSVSYSPPGFPVIDQHVFKPWWAWEKSPAEKELNRMSDFNNLWMELIRADEEKRQLIQSKAASLDIPGMVQNYAAYPVSQNANIHWFSPALATSGLWFGLLLFGLLIYFRKYRSTSLHLIILPLFILATYYLTKVGEIRYFFILNILLVPLTAIAIIYITSRAWKPLKAPLCTMLFLALILVSFSGVNHSRLYASSFIHNLVPEQVGIPELKVASEKMPFRHEANILTPANSEVAYYLDALTIWDYRLFFIAENEIKKYLDMYNVEYMIIPTGHLKPYITTGVNGEEVENIKINWKNSSIPHDSDFYEYITNKSKVKQLSVHKAFIVYERQDN